MPICAPQPYAKHISVHAIFCDNWYTQKRTFQAEWHFHPHGLRTELQLYCSNGSVRAGKQLALERSTLDTRLVGIRQKKAARSARRHRSCSLLCFVCGVMENVGSSCSAVPEKRISTFPAGKENFALLTATPSKLPTAMM